MPNENFDFTRLLDKIENLLERFSTVERLQALDISPEDLQEIGQSLLDSMEELRVAEEELRQQSEELLEANKLLEEERRRYEELFDFAPDGYLTTDPKGGIQEVNLAMADLLDAPREFIKNKPLILFVSSKDHVKFYQQLNDAERPRKKKVLELRIEPRNRRAFDARVTIAPIQDTEGRLTGIRWMFRDVTQEKEANAALRASEDRYRHLSENLERTVADKVEELRKAQSLIQAGQMVSVVAHEIRNPLQNIRMGVEMLRVAMGDEPEKGEILGEIDHGVNLLNNAIAELLEYSKPIEIHRTNWAVREICQQAIRGMTHRLGNILVMNSCDSSGETIHADGQKLIQVLMNLISNAVEAMPNGGELRVGSGIENNGEARFITFSVTDTGCGIPKDQIDQVQEPFFTTKVQGTGLGLSICRKLVEAHEGKLRIRSEVNRGTTVEILLPETTEK